MRVIEAVFEFVEHLDDDQTFTEPQLYRQCRVEVKDHQHFSTSTVCKVLRIMEHHGMVRRHRRGVDGKGRPIIWQRSAPVGPS